MPEDQIFIGVTVGPDVRLQEPPAERRERDAEVGDQAAVARVHAVLVDAEVRVVRFRTGGQRGNAAAVAGGRGVIARLTRLRPEQ